MHLLLITREFPPAVIGGVAYHALNLAEGLVGNGHEVTVLTSDSGDRIVDEPDRPERITVDRIDCRSVASPRYWFDRAVRRHLAESEILADVDIVHSHEYIRFGRVETSVPAITKVHYNIRRKPEFFPLGRYHPVVRPAVGGALRYGVDPLERSLARDALSASDGRIFISELAKRYRADRGSAGAGGSERVVYNGVDTDRFDTALGKSDDDYFLFVGGTQSRKGYELIERVATATDARFKVAGAGHPSERTDSRAVEFLGHVEQTELPALYRNAKALVHPAFYEPFGNVVLESLACGTPVIVSDPDHCGAAEVLSDKVAVEIDPDSTRELRAAVESFDPAAFDPAACHALAERFGWNDVATATVELARDVLDRT
ncbi:glycosyltransferase family 4 protein [Halosimplex pelagicum]|uniref:Glycosyltransferase family 4 protein n=1 Tax=Halosimplex pelagicum TaxID=869886 RepID=A0A7D5PEA2_9EURY|nr:glycosyltransferase family 4 protein [Halosimplex pelagicum]QLH81259.1 glycosyltransferase family 4 protein [Halosimplex pelagicum]